MRTIEYARVDKLVYRALWSTPDVEHFIHFFVDSRGYFDGGYGLRNPLAEEFGIESLIKYGHPNFQVIRKLRNPRTACSMSFAFGAFDNYTQMAWKRVQVQNGATSELTGRIAPFVRDRVFRIVRHVLDLNDLLEFLVADERPTNWFVTSPDVRAAQIVAIAKLVGIERSEVLRYLKPFEKNIAVHLFGRISRPGEAFVGNLDGHVDHLFSDFAPAEKQ